MEKNDLNRVSCYISVAQKISLELEVVYFKNTNTKEAKERNTINKNISFILEAFLDKYMDNISAVKEVVLSTLSISNRSDSNLTNKNMMRDMSVEQTKLVLYPLKLSETILNKFDLFRKKCEDEINFNFSKTTFYNIILLEYYIRNKEQIAIWQMKHWSQDYYKNRNTEKTNLEDVLKYFNTLLKKSTINSDLRN